MSNSKATAALMCLGLTSSIFVVEEIREGMVYDRDISSLMVWLLDYPMLFAATIYAIKVVIRVAQKTLSIYYLLSIIPLLIIHGFVIYKIVTM